MAGQKVSKRSGEIIHTQTRRRHLEVCRKSSAKAKITLGEVLEEGVSEVYGNAGKCQKNDSHEAASLSMEPKRRCRSSRGRGVTSRSKCCELRQRRCRSRRRRRRRRRRRDEGWRHQEAAGRRERYQKAARMPSLKDLPNCS